MHPVSLIAGVLSVVWCFDTIDYDEQVSSYCTQTFVILDKWLNQLGREKGDEALKIIKEALRNNTKANITYYQEFAKEAKENGHVELASQNMLLARLYKGLLE
ncbi:hypothetical protein Ngar_c20500 [Candidatus Nitrososphaera gargensis Ga9.2]|uniref:Uncharacterized protein n=1 Tax=Nitrososphaera gargensis (strain Ga9.2) TaxID=1237085 RepID=K0IKJ5_NITGG|nr:hypothetical protein [Candidatus Nitrososphaera gargensis]AFU58982.1 hypothetical protein Ngar_c20500 [Candidatus Nitrososphaera gargensis Ga9.2]